MFTPTQEQIENNELVQTGDNVLIEAGAGTGKSSTLRYFAQQNPNKNFLVICFNKANAEEAKLHPDKPSNIYYSTAHAIAYREIIAPDMDMKAKLQNYLNYKDINQVKLMSFVDAKDAKEEKKQLLKLCKAINDCITLYCRSDSRDLLLFAKELYSFWFSEAGRTISDDDVTIKEEPLVLSQAQQHDFAKITREHWLAIIDSGNKLYITHDVYFKLFHLREYKINYFWDKDSKEEIQVDVLCLDEAQDSNPVTVAAFDINTMQKILVGDAMQQLYAWRGAGDAMEMFPYFKKGKLSTSFRFNSTIATLANKVLTISGSDMVLKGNSVRTTIETKAHLCRTNAALLKAIVNYGNLGLRIYSNANLNELFSKLYHIQAVSFGNIPKYPNKTLKDIMTTEQLEEAMQVSQELKQLTNLEAEISKNGGLHNGIQRIKSCLVGCPEEADITVSTIHKSKGLEWDEIIIDEGLIHFKDLDDILPEDVAYELKLQTANWLDEKVNQCLLYVAITRGKVITTLPTYLETYF